MTPVRPYLVRALVDWIVDNDDTPYVVIDCSIDGVRAPSDRMQDGRLVLDISGKATRDLAIGNAWLDVGCRFAGEPIDIRAPIGAIIAVYSRESGMGMAFEAEDAVDGPSSDPPRPRPGGPKLTVVK